MIAEDTFWDVDQNLYWGEDMETFYEVKEKFESNEELRLWVV